MPKNKSRIKDLSFRLHVASDKRIDSQKSNSEGNITTSRRDSKKNTQLPPKFSDENQISEREINISIRSSQSKRSSSKTKQQITHNRREDFLKLNEELNPKKLLWNDDEGISIDHDFWISNVTNSSLQFSIWVKRHSTNMKIANIEENSVDDSIEEIDHQEVMLVGECYLNVNNFIRNHYQIPYFKAANQENRFETKLWLHGLTKGNLKGSVYMKCSPFLKQVTCGVNTEEERVQRMVSIVYGPNSASKVRKMRDELKEQHDLKKSLEENEFNILGKNDATNRNFQKNVKEEIEDMKSNLKKMLSILEKTEFEKSICFSYSSKIDLFKSQELLIMLGMNLVEYCSETNDECEYLYYDCLKAVLKRGELSLQNQCLERTIFDAISNDILKQNSKKNSSLSSPGKNPRKDSAIDRKDSEDSKQKIGLLYQEFLYKSLELSLNHLAKKALKEFERIFIEYFLGISYIRIPEFREELNKCLNADKEQVAELNGTEFEKVHKSKSDYTNAAIYEQFDWETEFYNCLESEQKYIENKEFLLKILSGKIWLHRFKKRGIGFMYFVKELCNYIHDTIIVKDTIPWQDIPGYNLILRAFLIEMKTKDLHAYPEAQINASCSLLYNKKLQNMFCTSLYKKTQLHDSNLVLKAFDLIDAWFQCQKDRKKTIPSNFDHYGLMKGIFMVINEDNSMSVAKAIWFVHKNYFMFPNIIIHEFHEYLLGKAFLRLFTHWSYTVRMVFHNLIWYRIYHKHKRLKLSFTDTEEQRLELLKILNTNIVYSNYSRYDICNDLINLEQNKTLRFLHQCKKKYLEKQQEIEPIKILKNSLTRKKMMLKVNKIDKLRYFDVCYDIKKEDLYNFFKKDLNLKPKELEFINEDDLEIENEQDVGENDENTPRSPSGSKKKAVGTLTPGRKRNSIFLLNGEQTPCLTKTNTTMGIQTQRSRKDSGNNKKIFSQYINNSGDRKNPITKTFSEPIEFTSTQSTLFTKRRTFLDLDDNTDNMFLEDDQLIYLQVSFKEFHLVRKEYTDWNKKFEMMVEENTKYNEKELYLYYDIPHCEILVPLDEQEIKEAEDPLDW